MPTYVNSDKRLDTDGNSTATLTGFAAGAGSRRELVVYLDSISGSIAAHSGVTWGGVSLTQRGSSLDIGSYGRTSTWYLPEASFPGGATGDVVGTCAASQDTIAIFATIASDVNQASPFENASQTTGTGAGSNAATLTITSSATALVIDHVIGVNSSTEDDAINVGTGTSRQEIEVAADYSTMAISTLAGASPNVTPTWTFTMTGGDTMSDWRMVGDALTHDAGGGGGGPAAIGCFKTLMGVGR